MKIDEFSIYDLYSEIHENKKSSSSPSTVSVGNNSMTTRSHYQMTNFEKCNNSVTFFLFFFILANF